MVFRAHFPNFVRLAFPACDESEASLLMIHEYTQQRTRLSFTGDYRARVKVIDPFIDSLVGMGCNGADRD